MKPGSESCLRELEGELACEAEGVDWLPGFYSLPPRVQIAGTKAYREGKVRNWQVQSMVLVIILWEYWVLEIDGFGCNLVM